MVQARAAGCAAEVPVGAVVVWQNQVIGVGQNAPIRSHDPCAHAEIVALRQAAQHVGNYRLEECELFVTLEPCAMCAGAMLHARLKRVVFGATDPKTGAAGSVFNLFDNKQLNHHTQVSGGLLASDCAKVLQDFFVQQRARKLQAAKPLREDALRTPSNRFDKLPAMPGSSVELCDLPMLQGLRLHYVDAGPLQAAQVTLCLHGWRSWSLVWRDHMLAGIARGERVLAVDLIGFGKSDKLKKVQAIAALSNTGVLTQWIEQLDLHNILVLEPLDDAFPGELPGQTLGESLQRSLPTRVLDRQSISLEPMYPEAAQAPYPDEGHRAALRGFENAPGLKSKRT
jgi:tRNA(adenine34) deaminase